MPSRLAIIDFPKSTTSETFNLPCLAAAVNRLRPISPG